MRAKKYPTHTTFPIKKCWIASLVILLVAVIVLGLLYAIVGNKSALKEKSWIFLLVWGIVFGVMLVGYWIHQIRKYIKTRKDEN